MTEPISPELRLVATAALAWLHEHDSTVQELPVHAELLDASIDRDALAVAIDSLDDLPLVTALRAIRDEDYDALGLADQREAIRSGDGDYLVIDAMRLAARRALEAIGDS